MSGSRLSRALAEGMVRLPESGRIAVLRPPADADLSPLPAERVHVITGFRPDHDAWSERGLAAGVAPEPPYGAAVLFLPRARALARALVARAAALVPGGPVILDGQKACGIEAMLRALRERGMAGPVLAAAHGKLVVIEAPGEAFADWHAGPVCSREGYLTAPGLFSADGPDPASVALAGVLPGSLAGRVADLGAGWGYLSARALARAPAITEMHLVEAEHAALAAARANVTDPRGRFHWADVRRFRPDAPFDAVLMNPPFHEGRRADPALGRDFIVAAARMLARHGTLWLVANRHLPYERALAGHFTEVRPLAGPAGFKLIRAAHPLADAGRRKRRQG